MGAETEGETVDNSALRLMLSYVEAECLRLGATEAAHHAAMAAALMPARTAPAARMHTPDLVRRVGGLRRQRLH